MEEKLIPNPNGKKSKKIDWLLSITLFVGFLILMGVTCVARHHISRLLTEQDGPYVVNRVWTTLSAPPEIETEKVEETPFEDCGSKGAEVYNVEVIPCNLQDDVCVLRKGTNSTLRINFLSNVDSSSVKVKVYGIIGKLPIPFHIPQSDGCQNSGLLCPLKAGSNYTYEQHLPVLKTYPSLSVTVKWELVNLVCITIPAKIDN